MTPADQKERDKRHVRSLQNPRVIADFRLCNVSCSDADRAELLGMISYLHDQLARLNSDAFKQPKRKQTDDRTNADPHSALA